MISVHSNISFKKKGPRGPFYLFLFFLRSDAGTKEQQKNEEKIEKKKEKKKEIDGPTIVDSPARPDDFPRRRWPSTPSGRSASDRSILPGPVAEKKKKPGKKNNHFKLLLCADVDHEEEVSFLRLEAFFVKTNIDV